MESQLTTHNRRVETEVLARQGLRLPPITLKCLRTAGIYCQPSVSIEHQHLAKKYVLRGVESGGAVAEVGAYASYVGEQGNALPWLQRVDSVGVNGVHAVVRSEEHTSELQSHLNLVCRLLLEKKKKNGKHDSRSAAE